METLNIERLENGIVLVELATPKRGNPFGPQLWEDVASAFEELGKDTTCKAIVLTGGGPHFSYGLDLMETAPQLMPYGEPKANAAKIRALGEAYQAAFSKIVEANQPVIAVIHGWCIGAGLEMVAHADIRVCSEDAKFSLREVKVCIVPDVGGIQRIPYIIGEGHLREMALTGDDYDSNWALRVGLVNRVFPTKEDAVEDAMRVANTIAGNPQDAVTGIKEVLNKRNSENIGDALNDALTRNETLLQSEGFMTAVSDFMSRK